MAADHQESSVAKAAAVYPPKQIADTMAFMDEILAELAAAPDVAKQLVALLKGLAKHGGDCDAVGSRAAELLRGHPDVLRRFTDEVYADAPAEDAISLTRPRRSRRRCERRDDTKQQTPAAAAEAPPPEAPPNVAAAPRSHRGDGGQLRLDADAARALTFVRRVHETAGPVVHASFLAVLSEAKGSEDMFADEVYDRAKRAFGPAHVGLLHAFATAWLPGEQEWKLQQREREPAARRRSRASAPAAASSHAAAGMTDAKKKPRAAADDGNNARRHYDPAAHVIVPRRRRNGAADSSHDAAGMLDAKNKARADDGNKGRQHDLVMAVMEVRNVKKRRGGEDDGTGRRRQALRICESSGGVAAAQARGNDDDDDYAPRSRKRKPHSVNGELSGSAAAAAPVLGADASGVHHAYSCDNKKPPRRRAASGGKGSSAGPEQQPERDDGEFRRFRQEWEFQTCYSKLVATSDRVTELLRPTRTPHGHGDGGGGNRSLEELFPLPECREFLRNCYGGRWGEMRAALERGESRVPALEAIERSLAAKEEEAIAEESRKRCRHDPGRVARRLHGLAADTLDLDEECRRRHHGGGA